MSLLAELELVRALALEATTLVRTFSGPSVAVQRKHEDEPVSEADHAANDLIVRRLRAAFPGDGLLSEELPDDGSRLTHSRVWMVDPIDGTREFIRGENDYTIMIGLCVDGRPQVGVVAQPAHGLLWCGAAGEAAWKEGPDGDRVPLRVSSLAQPPGIRLVASKSRRTADVDQFRQALGITDEINVGSVGLKVGLIADGSRDLYVYPGGRTKKWDTCAPEAVIVAAGGRMTDTDGRPIAYRDPDVYNRTGIVASNGHLHDRVIATIAGLQRDAGREP